METSPQMNDKNFTNPLWINYVVSDPELIPHYQTLGSAACDLHASEDVTIKAGRREIVGTGLKLEIPEGFVGQVCPRSGLAVKYGVTVLNAPGIIDSDFRGEIKVILFNSGDQDFELKKGDRIAQLMLTQYFQAVFKSAGDLSSTQRGEGGFGSTGK